MKVYVIEYRMYNYKSNEFIDNDVVAVFDSKDKAKAFIFDLMNEHDEVVSVFEDRCYVRDIDKKHEIFNEIRYCIVELDLNRKEDL